MPPRTGRPPTTGETRTHVKHVRLSSNDLALMEAAAAKAGQLLAVWMHDRLLAAAKPRAAKRAR